MDNNTHHMHPPLTFCIADADESRSSFNFTLVSLTLAIDFSGDGDCDGWMVHEDSTTGQTGP